ncbi:hypothetical protein MN608_07317 [Microdochium nivale]|nr:hypothetical protein MN608_07317 [Microdochium nivale]
MPIPTSTKGSPSTDHTQQQQQGTSAGSTAAAAAVSGAGIDTGAGTTREKTQAELDADRLYEEAMEDEYAKREGGA